MLFKDALFIARRSRASSKFKIELKVGLHSDIKIINENAKNRNSIIISLNIEYLILPSSPIHYLIQWMFNSVCINSNEWQENNLKLWTNQGFIIKLPQTQLEFEASSENEKNKWIELLNSTLSTSAPPRATSVSFLYTSCSFS